MEPRKTTHDYRERGQVRIVRDAQTLAVAAADMLNAAVAAAISQHDRAFLCLSGGSTPKQMGALLAQPPRSNAIAWDHVEIFWGDERWVPLQSQESNAGEALRTFINAVGVPDAQIHPIPTDTDVPEQAAEDYEHTLRDVAPTTNGVPTFDLVFLGMGNDGHTASLFPDTAAVHEQERWVIAHFVPAHNSFRITLTPPAINAARQVVFLISGKAKAQTLARVLEGPQVPDRLPAQMIRPTRGSLLWLIDEAAASALTALEA